MAFAEFFEAFTTVADSTKAPGSKTQRITSVTLRVGAVDGRAYVAAANDAARLATDVGVLLASIEVFFLGGATAIVEHGVRAKFVSDAFLPLDPESEIYNSNKLLVGYSSIVAGLTKNFSFSIPQRDGAQYTVESNGTNVVVGAGASAEVLALIAAVSNTALSLYGTAINPVMEITINDQ